MSPKSYLTRLRDAGFTQMQIAMMCGITQATVSSIWRGDTKDPAYSIGRRLEAMADQFAPAKRKATRKSI